MILKDGSEVQDPRLDRLYEEDWNSLNFPVTAKLEEIQPYDNYELESFDWSFPDRLDQGQEGACVGFAYTHWALARPNVVRSVNGQVVDALFAREKVYWPAQNADEWAGGSYPGGDPFYEGTSVLAGAKVMVELDLCTRYFWALTLQQLALGVSFLCPAVLGIKVYEGMFTPDENGFIHLTGKIVGGHAILCYGVVVVWKDPNGPKTWDNVDMDASYFKLRNSWGRPYGIDGDCYMSFADMDVELNDQGDAAFCIAT